MVCGGIGDRRDRAQCLRCRRTCARHSLGAESVPCRRSPSWRPGTASSGSSSLVSMMKASDHRHGNDSPEFRGLNRPSVRRVLLKRKMTTQASIIAEVAGDLSSQRRLVHHDDVIQTLSANRADQPFHARCLPGRLECCEQFGDRHVCCLGPECVAADPVTVAQKVARCRIARERLHELSGRPVIRQNRGRSALAEHSRIPGPHWKNQRPSDMVGGTGAVGRHLCEGNCRPNAGRASRQAGHVESEARIESGYAARLSYR